MYPHIQRNLKYLMKMMIKKIKYINMDLILQDQESINKKKRKLNSKLIKKFITLYQLKMIKKQKLILRLFLKKCLLKDAKKLSEQIGALVNL